MEKEFQEFVSQFNKNSNISLAQFFYQAELHLAKQLKHFLQIETSQNKSLYDLIMMARRKGQTETNKQFWEALLAFNKVSFNPNKKNDQPWLRFVNIIESLQEYSGSQLFDATQIGVKRTHRLYFAYMLSWEHLRYIAGNDDGYSPSSEVLAIYSSAHFDE